MSRKTTIEVENTNIKEVKVSWSVLETNKLLETGDWLLLHGSIAHKDDAGFQAKPCWLLAKTRPAQPH